MRRVRRRRLAALSALCLALQAAGPRHAIAQPGAGGDPVAPGTTDRARHVARVALGIMGYARWPVELPTVRLCLLGPTEHAEALIEGGSLPGGRRVAAERVTDDADLAERCDVVYVGPVPEAQWQALYRQFAGRPILSICEEPAPCRAGGMFCLHLQGADVGFEVNLDSVARSGVRVHPQVLQLGRRRPGTT